MVGAIRRRTYWLAGYLAAWAGALSLVSLIAQIVPPSIVELPLLISGTWRAATAYLFSWERIFPRVSFSSVDRDLVIALTASFVPAIRMMVSLFNFRVVRSWIYLVLSACFALMLSVRLLQASSRQPINEIGSLSEQQFITFHVGAALLVTLVYGFYGDKTARRLFTLLIMTLLSQSLLLLPSGQGGYFVDAIVKWLEANQYQGA